MLIAFILTMPNNASWNGKWSGDGDLYAVVESVHKKNVEKLADDAPYYYNFGDGWTAKIEIKPVTSKEATKIRKKSKGFCGYNWMVRSIINHGEILA